MQIIVNSFLIKKLYDRLLGSQELQGVAAVIAGQNSERQQALAYGIPPDKIFLLPNGMDLSTHAELPDRGAFRQKFGIPAAKKLILFLGRINRKKGTDMVVEAFAQVDDRNLHLAIVGPDDGQLAEVQRLVAKHDLKERVILPGLLSGKDVFAAYVDADIFVLPCRTDTFPMSIVEACLADTPMIVTEGCESAHLVKDRVADVVPFEATIFAKAISNLLTDTERYERYRANCGIVMQDTFSISAIGDQLETIYRGVISEKRHEKREFSN
jgi:glycosyltransferase involved in cell wall biosynthesis